jgi:hypothetical protein
MKNITQQLTSSLNSKLLIQLDSQFFGRTDIRLSSQFRLQYNLRLRAYSQFHSQFPNISY